MMRVKVAGIAAMALTFIVLCWLAVGLELYGWNGVVSTWWNSTMWCLFLSWVASLIAALGLLIWSVF